MLGVATLLTAIIFFMTRNQSGNNDTAASKYTVSNRPLYTAAENRRKVTLFFPGTNGFLLIPREREIYATSAITNQMKQIVVELIKGPGPDDDKALPALPESTRLREVYLRGDTAYVDLTKDVSENLPGGSEAELLTIYSVVDSLTFNFTEIKCVKILVEGAEVETLTGHIDLTKPLFKDLGFVSNVPTPGV